MQEMCAQVAGNARTQIRARCRQSHAMPEVFCEGNCEDSGTCSDAGKHVASGDAPRK
jgi:hypothetical protein